MIGRYNLPTDDLLAAYVDTAVITASAEDPAYPVTNWGARKPSKPSKLTTTDGWWEIDFGVPVNAAVLSLIYHNFDPGLDWTLKWNSSSSWVSPAGSVSGVIPAWSADAYPVSPWEDLPTTPTAQFYRLEVGLGSSPSNSNPLSLGRWYLGGALRDTENDVRWGVEEIEDHSIIEMRSDLGAVTAYDMGTKRRGFNGEMALTNTVSTVFIELLRSARARVYPWLLIPDVDVNEALFGRFLQPSWSRTRETINHNIFPFRFEEDARGVDWP